MTDQTPTCPTCGIDLRYPTGLHIVDCPATQANQTPSTENVERARFNVSGVHHIIGTECLCGARRLHKNRDRTEHILDAFIKELDLAAHDRAVKAAALREAAEAILPPPNIELTPTGAEDRSAAAFVATLLDVHHELNARADRIEAGNE